MRPQLIHDHIDRIHITSINLFRCVTFGKVLDQFIHGGLVVTHGRRERVHGLFAGNRVGIGSSHSHELGDRIEHNELLFIEVKLAIFLYFFDKFLSSRV